MPDPPPTTGAYGSLNALLPLLEHLAGEGFDPRVVLERAGIPASVLDEPKARFPHERLEALWLAAVDLTGDPSIALRVSTRVRPSTLGVIGYLALVSESGRRAFELVRGLTPLLWEGVECELECSGATALIRCRSGNDRPASRFTTDYAVGLMVSMGRAFGSARSDPLEARFSFQPPAHAHEYEAILRLPVRFGAGEDGVLFPIAMLDGSNPSADAALRQLLEQYAADQLARTLSNAPLARRVRACIVSDLRGGNLSADSVAARLALSARTLRRRLRDEGTSFQEILDDVRGDLARRYLSDERRAVGEVAFLLGFSDPSAFTKAFRRWTGRAPADLVRTTPR